MKKIYYILIFISSFFSAQIELGSYINGSGKNYNLEITEQKFINAHMPSIDNHYDDFFFKLSFSKAKIFKESMIEVKNKFVEWRKTADENKLKDFHKKLNINIGSFDVVFISGRHHFFSPNTELFAELNVDKNGIYLAIANEKEIVSSVNQFVTSEGFLLYFHEPKDLENFINSIDIEKAKELYDKNFKTDKIFN